MCSSFLVTVFLIWPFTVYLPTLIRNVITSKRNPELHNLESSEKLRIRHINGTDYVDCIQLIEKSS
jgi:hypothetical protein